jgi:tRNA(fMet)-specific endonuclease VapC
VLGGRAAPLASIQDFQFLLPTTHVGELSVRGAELLALPQNLALVERFLARCVIVPVTESTGLRADSPPPSREGRPIPENDLWIAAACSEDNRPLEAVDSHFDVVESLARHTI